MKRLFEERGGAAVEESFFGCDTRFETAAGRNFLVLTGEGLKSELIEFQVEMIARNKISGVIGPSVREKDSEIRLYYDLTGLIDLPGSLARRELTVNGFLLILDRLVSAILESKRYLLDDNSFILEERLIYISPGSLEVFALYLPKETGQDINRSFRSLLTGLLEKKYNPSLPDNLVRELLDAAAAEGFCLSGFRNRLRDIKNDISGPMFIHDLAPCPPYLEVTEKPYRIEPEQEGRERPGIKTRLGKAEASDVSGAARMPQRMSLWLKVSRRKLGLVVLALIGVMAIAAVVASTFLIWE